MSGPLTVLVVDDSAFMRKMVTKILSDGGLEVVGTARDGVEAVEMVARLQPDVVTLDVEMPRMNGVEALGEIRKLGKSAVVMLSSVTVSGAATTIRCLESGAFDFVAKPSGAISLNIDDVAMELLAKVTAAGRSSKRRVSAPASTAPVIRPTGHPRMAMVVIASSTGGPRALQVVIPALPKDLGVPVVVVQHMPASFTQAFASRLNECSALTVKEAGEGSTIRTGEVLVAAGGSHLEFDMSGKATLNDGPPVHGVRPSADITIASLVRNYGPRLVGVVLTGMGCDGAAGMAAIKKAGGLTLAEDESTCVVFGMPKAAIQLGAVDRVLPLEQIASGIVEAVMGVTPGRRIA